MVKNPQKKGQHSDFGSGGKLLWLETATNSPGVSLYYEETIHSSRTEREWGNGAKKHMVR
jgi:hypothetical protein